MTNEAELSSPPEPSGEKPAILLVDDNQGVLGALARQLNRAGYQTIPALGGRAGLEAVPDQPYALIIVDYGMAEVSGMEVLAAAEAFCPEVPRLALTGNIEAQVLAECINSGLATRVLLKPWDDAALLRIVNELVETYQMRQDYRRLTLELKRNATQLEQLQIDLQAANEGGELESKYSLNADSAQDLIALLSYVLDLMGGGNKQSQRVAMLSSSLAAAQGLSAQEVWQVEAAGLLKDIANIALPQPRSDSAASQELAGGELPPEIQPMLAGEILKRISGFEGIAELVKQMQTARSNPGENQDWRNSPVGAQILAIAETFDEQMYPDGKLSQSRPQSALDALERESGASLNEDLVRLFRQSVLPTFINEDSGAVEIALKDLVPGMILASDAMNNQGVPLIAKGTPLTTESIRNLRTKAGFQSIFSRILIKTCSIPVAEGEGDVVAVFTASATAARAGQSVPIKPAEAMAAQTKPSRTGVKRTVVVIDDNPNVVSALRRELESGGYRVKFFFDPHEGLNFIRSNDKVHAVVSDYMMPGLLGSQLLKLIHEIRPTLPCIIITAHATQDTIARLAISARPARVFAKPWDKQLLLDTLASFAEEPA